MAKPKSTLTAIPGVGPSLAVDLEKLGYKNVSDLKSEEAETMYTRLMDIEGKHVDRCVLYVFRCAVYFVNTSNPEPKKLVWWNWKD